MIFPVRFLSQPKAGERRKIKTKREVKNLSTLFYLRFKNTTKRGRECVCGRKREKERERAREFFIYYYSFLFFLLFIGQKDYYGPKCTS